MLYALQTASTNLRLTRFEASDVTDVVIDRDDVHRTSIGGPQWFEEDFEEEEEEEEDGAEDDAAEPAAAAAEDEAGEVAAAAPDQGGKVQTKIQTKMTMEEAREKVRGVIHNWILDSVEAKARRELT